jgi:hypothetical protein
LLRCLHADDTLANTTNTIMFDRVACAACIAVLVTVATAGSAPFTGATPPPSSKKFAAAFSDVIIQDTRSLNLAVSIGTTVVGTATGAAPAPRFDTPSAMASDPAPGGTWYVVEILNHRIVKASYSGATALFVGGGNDAASGNKAEGYANGVGTNALFAFPSGIAVPRIGGPEKAYVGDSGNGAIREVSPFTGAVTTVAGPAPPTVATGWVDGVGNAARFRWPDQMAIDNDQVYLYIVDRYNNAIRKMAIVDSGSTVAGTVSTVCGAGQPNPTWGFVDGPATTARFKSPLGISVWAGIGYVADSGNNAIRKFIMATGVVSTIAGTGEWGYNDGIGATAKFRWTYSVAVALDGNLLFVGDMHNQVVRTIDLTAGGNNAVKTLVTGQGPQMRYVGVPSVQYGGKLLVTENHLVKLYSFGF